MASSKLLLIYRGHVGSVFYGQIDDIYQMRMYRKPLSKIQDYCWVVVSGSLSHCARVSTFLFGWLAEQSARRLQYKTQLNTHSKLVLNVFWTHQCCQLPPLYKLRSVSHSGSVVIAVREAKVYKKY